MKLSISYASYMFHVKIYIYMFIWLMQVVCIMLDPSQDLHIYIHMLYVRSICLYICSYVHMQVTSFMLDPCQDLSRFIWLMQVICFMIDPSHDLIIHMFICKLHVRSKTRSIFVCMFVKWTYASSPC